MCCMDWNNPFGTRSQPLFIFMSSNFHFYGICSCDIIKQLVMLFFRQGSVDSKDVEAQGTLLRK